MDPRKRAVFATCITVEVGSAAFGLEGRRLAPHDGPVARADGRLGCHRLDGQTGLARWGRCGWLGHDPVPGSKGAPEGPKEGHLTTHGHRKDHHHGNDG